MRARFSAVAHQGSQDLASQDDGVGAMAQPVPRLPKCRCFYKTCAGEATWRSGYATVCKTVYTSSILVVASNISLIHCSHFFSDLRFCGVLRFARLGPFVIRRPIAASAVFLGSSAVEHSTVNRMVAGSNPARGASKFNHLQPIAKTACLAGKQNRAYLNP